MRFYKSLLAVVSVTVGMSVYANVNDRLTPEEAMKQAQEKGWLNGISKEGEIAKTEKYREELEKITGKQSKQIVNNAKVYFQKLEAENQPSEQPVIAKKSEIVDKTDLDIFISLSMSDSALKKALEQASFLGARVLFQGLAENSNSIFPVLHKLKALSEHLEVEPHVQLDPVKFKKYAVTAVPVMIYRQNGNEYKVRGTLAADWLINRAGENNKTMDFGVMGQMREVSELNIIDEAERRNAMIDWDREKKQAIERFWKKKQFFVLPATHESKTYFMDPTIRVTQDIVDLGGNVIAKAGQVVNPAENMPYQLKVIVFDATNEKQTLWAMNKLEEWKDHKLVLVSTRFDRQDGWKHLQSIRNRFQREVKLLNKEMVDVFGLEHSPATIQTVDGYLKIEQIGRPEYIALESEE